MCKLIAFVALLIVMATPTIAAAPKCNHFVNASMRGDGGLELIFADDEEIDSAHFVEQGWGGRMFECVTYHVPGANGGDVIPTKCTQSGSNHRVALGNVHEFLGQTVGSPNVLLFQGAIWYSACGTDLQPYNGTDAFPTRKR